MGCGKMGDETFKQDNMMLNKPVPLPSEFFTEEKNTIMRREKGDAIYEQPQLCPSLPRQSESFGPSEVGGTQDIQTREHQTNIRE